MTTSKLNGLTVALIVCVVILAILLVQTCNTVRTNDKNNIALINSLNDTIRKINDSTYQTSVMQTSNPKDFLDLRIKDEEIKDLQAVVKQYRKKLEAGSSVTNFKNTTTVKNTNATIITKIDTVLEVRDGVTFKNIYPTYMDSIKNKWIDYKVVMNKDTSSLFLKIYNSYSAVVGKDKGKPFVDVISHNPYSDTTTAIRSFQVSLPKPKKFGIGFSGGATYYNQKVQPYIGVGLNYNLIRF